MRCFGGNFAQALKIDVSCVVITRYI